MNLSNKQLKKYLDADRNTTYTEFDLHKTVQNAKIAFAESEAKEYISHAEFLYQQSKYIHKRFAIMQGLLLFALWMMLQLVESNFYIQRCLGIGSSLFAMFLLPELWKNRNTNALEIESVSYFSLRQIYTARIFFLALIDFTLLCAFTIPIALSERLQIEEMIIQFFLPYIMTCCICFRTLNMKKIGTETFSLFLCVIWCAIWTQIILNEKIYYAISLPMWLFMTVISIIYLGYCIYKAQNDCSIGGGR